ncbi:caspase family protein [Paracrocinitomix mangrovi]|uniref:caspase family protein n=1 Tax=Paracrocinitomix mangrovi TaxID=2862509 RepID=UPI001C8DDC8B|nr:caspase family protein [Paracrocinitomix mangrovi]UKN02300.1 caspase family protein [Paracrocinitomix mangrovi]
MQRLLLSFVVLLSFYQSTAQTKYPLETILQKGHAKYVTCADFHPSGKYAVTGGFDNAIILWNVQTGKEIRVYNRHSAPIWSVEFSPNGEEILSASQDHSVKLYNVINGHLIRSWEFPNQDIRQAYFSPDGKKMVTYSRDEMKIYDVKTGDLVGEYKKNYSAFYMHNVINNQGDKVLNTSGYKGAEIYNLNTGDTILHIPFDKVFEMSFSPDGSKVLLSSSKLFAKIFDANTGKVIADLTDPDSEERCDGCNTKHAWSNNSDFVVTMSNKVDAILWDANSGKKLRSFNDNRDRPSNMVFSPNDDYVVINVDETIFAYHVKSGKKTMEVKSEKVDYYEINFSVDGKSIILPGENNTAAIWDVTTGKKVSTLGGYLNKDRDDGLRYSYDNWTEEGILEYISMKRGFALSPNGEHLVIGGVDSTALMINVKTGKVEKEFKGHSKVVIAYDFSPDGKTVATGSGDRTIKLWDVESGKLKETLKGHRNLVFDLSFNSDGSKIASASWDGTMAIWNLDNGEYRMKDMGGNSPYCIGFSPNDLYVVTGDLKNRFEFWEQDAMESFRNLVGNTDVVGSYDFSPDGTQLVTASWDGKVKVWHTLSGMLQARNSNHHAPAYSVAWDPKGRFIASGGADNNVIIWNPETNEVLATLYGHNNPVTDLAFTADGKKLISCSNEGMIKVWDLATYTEDYSRIQISRDQWLSTTANGYFDGSSKALGLVNYVSGLEVVPVSSLFDKYFSPGLIKRLSEGETFNDTGERIGELIESSPLIAFHLTESKQRAIPVANDSVYKWKKDKLPLGIEINSQDVALSEIRIYNNGKLVISESLDKEIVFRGGDKDIRTYEIPLSDGRNEISGIVINKNRTESAPKQVVVDFDGVAAQTELYILTIGINDYKNPKYNLDFAVNDASAFSKAIVKGGDTLFNAIHDYSITNDKATKSEITRVMQEIKEKIGPEDVFVFYYAGHGVMGYAEKPEDADFYIVTHDVTNLYGDVEMLNNKALSAKELMQLSMEVSAEKQLFILDACHSGGALNSLATRGDGREKALAQLARSTGTFFLTAAQDAQYANEVGNLKHGLFTYAILEVLEGDKGDNGDSKITVNELKSYVEDRVPELSEEFRGSPQYPTSYSFGQDFPIVLIK